MNSERAEATTTPAKRLPEGNRSPLRRTASTLVVALAALLVVGAAAWVWYKVPMMLEARIMQTAAFKAERVALSVTQTGLRLNDPAKIEAALNVARQDSTLFYLLVADAEGTIIEPSFNPVGADNTRYWDAPENGTVDASGATFKIKLSVVLSDGTLSTMYMGLDFAPYRPELNDQRRMAGGLSLFLLVVALGIVIAGSLVKRLSDNYENLDKLHRGLRDENKQLERQLGQYRNSEVELRESEERYRGLFENAMETAYQDLEAMNQNLEEQKAELEREIAEKKRAEVALRESEERWRRLVESHPEPIIITVAGRIAYINKAGTDVLGAKSPHALFNKPITDFVDPRHRTVFQSQLHQADITGAVRALECIIVRLDGTERYTETFSVSVVHSGQKAIQTVVRDITERRDNEVALRRYTERLKALNEIEHSMLGAAPPPTIAQLALNHLRHLIPHTRASVIEYEYMSGEAVLLSAYSKTNTQLKTGARVALNKLANQHDDDPERIRYVRDLRALPVLTRVEQQLLNEGILSYFHVPLIVQDEVVGTLNLGSEHTGAFSPESINIAREVADLLAVSVRQARLDAERRLYESELISAKEQAEEMARLKSIFLTNMSHEIRTPLSGIIGFAQVLYEEIAPEHREFAELIEDSARRLLDTINSVLDLARLESGRMSLMLEPMNIAQLAEQTVRLLEPLADKRGLTLEMHAHQPDAWTKVDKASFDRVVTNLVGNAIKFTHEGGVTVTVDANDEDVMLYVQDTGIGISPDFLPMLFDEFRQEEAGADRSHEGSGLGLAITKKLVTRMGGDISVASTKGQGSTFTVRFPRLAQDHQQASDVAPSASSTPSKPKARILILEDKEDAQFMLEYQMRPSFVTDVVPDMEAAIRLARTNRYDAILVDIMLGEETITADALSRLRKLPHYDRVPFVAIATQILPESWSDVLALGFNGYVANPFVREEIIESISAALSQMPHPSMGGLPSSLSSIAPDALRF